MSDFDYNLNNSFEYNQNKVNQNTIENNKYEFNTMKRQKSPVIYDIGMDNYVFNEIQKAKYQGVFDPTSFGNKNIFMDSNRRINKHSESNNLQKERKSIKYNRAGDGKNLLIIKSETINPVNYKYNTVTTEMDYHSSKNINISNYNLYNKGNKNNDYRNTFARSNENKRNYFSPVNNEKKFINFDTNNLYETKTINIEKLNKDYNKRFNNPNRTLYEKYSTNTISFNDINKNFSPTFAPSRNQNYIKEKNMQRFNNSYFNYINSINKDENDFTNNNSFDNENEYYIENYNKYNKEKKIDLERNKEEEIKKIKNYRTKLLTLFFWHINNFYRLHFKNLFNEVIKILKRTINNKEHNFENKSIKNIAFLKQELKTNSYFYGYNNQYKNILSEAKIINNKIKEEKSLRNNNNINTQKENSNEIEKNNKDLEEESQIKNKIIWNKKIIPNKENKNNCKIIENNNKYVKKRISQGIYGKKIIQKKINLTKTIISSSQGRNYNKNNFKTNNSIQNSEKTPIIQKKLKFPKSININDNILNSGKKMINEYYKLNNEELEKKNMNSINISQENGDKEQKNNNEIDKNTMYSIINQSEKKNDYDIEDNENDYENDSNKKLENAMAVITKVIENKEKTDKKHKIETLTKIINNKINKEKNNNKELIKNYFDKLRQKETQKQNFKKLIKRKIAYPKNLIKNTKLKGNKKLKKDLFLSDYEDNNEEKSNINLNNNENKSYDDNKLRNKKNQEKFRIIIKQIRINKNEIHNIQYNDNKQIRYNTPNRTKDKSFVKINNKTPTNIIKKSILIILDKNNKNSINKNNNDNEIENPIKIEEKEKENENKSSLNNNINNNKEENDLEEPKSKSEENLNINELENHDHDINEEKEEKKLERNFSIESFTKYRKSKFKYNQDDEDNINEEDISLTEKYQDCENFVYFLRTQLIYCFLTNKSYNDEIVD